jgi:AraC family transcriptional regulator
MKNATILQEEYTARINKVFDYIEKNLDKDFTLAELAETANFSVFHFNRVFKANTGERPFEFIKRVRLERAASLIATRPKDSISEIALTCGFNDHAVFSRNFKSHFEISPSAYRKKLEEESNFSQLNSKLQQAATAPQLYFCSRSQTIKWKTDMKQNKGVEIKDFPKMNLAYVRHIGPYKGDESLFENLWNKLFNWAGPRGLVGGPDFSSLIIYHDDPGVTTDDKLRTSVCITVPEGTKVDGEIGKMSLEPARCMVARFEIDATEFESAWDWVYGQWLPNSGYVPDDKPCFEMYPEEAKNGKFTVDICVPVKPM